MPPSILQNYRFSDDEWDVISHRFPPEPQLETRGVGRPPTPHRDSLQGILYWLADALPKRRLKQYTGLSYDTLATRLDLYIELGIFRALWADAVENHHELVGLRHMLLLIDGAINISPNGGQSTGPNPTDRAKSGSKRSLMTEARGVPLSLVIAGANRNDRALVSATLAEAVCELPAGATASFDGGYTGKPVAATCADANVIAHVSTRAEKAPFHRSPVEQAHQKYNRFRGIKVRVLRLDRRWQALLDLASAIIVWRATSYQLATI